MKHNWLIILTICILVTGCSPQPQQDKQQTSTKQSEIAGSAAEVKSSSAKNQQASEMASGIDQPFKGYEKIVVDGGDMSGYRKANVAVDIGFGDREYWAFTNKYGQLVKVTAKEIILQDDRTEAVTANGRYYNDEADVPGTECADMDKGHIIADSLGGVSNAYNITPQESTLNRHGDQAYMERVIRDAGGCTDFEATITYPDTTTEIPSHYHYTYRLKGNVVTDDFDNVNPDKVNKTISEKTQSKSTQKSPSKESHDISSIDKNGDGQVTIAEAKAVGFKMPITKEHWLYPYMDDRDGDGMVGE
ncbi:DNA/RNA non-specific endonuclease [Aminipila terrae]|uniref:Type VII secretion system protein EssD-like domain-containing protein n=1 Tax=Aminipila terrae TaxID=2697030 RepID=A0A6P1MP42_9FIRM|nr:DNA/RNA non-specific endonuclease [Aminipila terrae]QHI73446.1 hypothetical protein Ami3637_14630 [Aminipila terrae]